MKFGALEFCVAVLLALVLSPEGVFGIRFVIDREECFSYDVQYEGDTVHTSFVVIKSDKHWYGGTEGVDLVVSSMFLPIELLSLFVSFRDCVS